MLWAIQSLAQLFNSALTAQKQSETLWPGPHKIYFIKQAGRGAAGVGLWWQVTVCQTPLQRHGVLWADRWRGTSTLGSGCIWFILQALLELLLNIERQLQTLKLGQLLLLNLNKWISCCVSSSRWAFHTVPSKVGFLSPFHGWSSRMHEVKWADLEPGNRGLNPESVSS